MSESCSRDVRNYDIARYILTRTDPQHPKSLKEISAALKNKYPDLTEKCIMRCIHRIRQLGYEIGEDRDGHAIVYYSKVTLTFWALSTLIAILESSNYLSRETTEKMINTVCLLAPGEMGRELRRTSHFINFAKTKNNCTTETIAAITEAISKDRKICFRYSRPTKNGKNYYYNGDRILASPVALVPQSERLYIICIRDADMEKRTYRIDCMENTAVIEENILPEAVEARLTLPQDVYGVFSMFHGERCEKVTLIFPESYLQSVYDRFGEDIVLAELSKEADQHLLTATVSVEVSKYFLWWVIEGGGQMKILSPEWVREKQIDLLHESGLTYLNGNHTATKKQPGSANPG